ncbi:MAG TPA: GNAT family N-acetyltransferase [Firmicutes bacterium]|nr:GNAT family N-acetyltransferase [Candidatus Fermentithermobacillaceae bacterium]
MAILGYKQPEIIEIDDNLRLRAYDGNFCQALPWYQDPVVYYNSEGITDPSEIPDEDYVRRMYEYLSQNGECYFIEVLEGGEFVPIGDVTLKEENPPIVIGVPKYRGIGIGKKVMRAIIARARELGIKRFYNTAIYDYNTASRRLFESVGFRCVGKRGNVMIYEMDLNPDAGT